MFRSFLVFQTDLDASLTYLNLKNISYDRSSDYSSLSSVEAATT